MLFVMDNVTVTHLNIKFQSSGSGKWPLCPAGGHWPTEAASKLDASMRSITDPSIFI